MADQENQDNVQRKRDTFQTNRLKTTDQRKELQKKREDLFARREQVVETEGDGEREAELERMQDEVDLLQKGIMKLQGSSHIEQDEVNALRRLADSYADENQVMAEDAQTRRENMQTLQENVQRLREDMQRQREEWKKRDKEKQ